MLLSKQLFLGPIRPGWPWTILTQSYLVIRGLTIQNRLGFLWILTWGQPFLTYFLY